MFTVDRINDLSGSFNPREAASAVTKQGTKRLESNIRDWARAAKLLTSSHVSHLKIFVKFLAVKSMKKLTVFSLNGILHH